MSTFFLFYSYFKKTILDIMTAKIIAISTSDRKQVKKNNVEKAIIEENYGIDRDAHADSGTHRQISLLAIESIDKMRGIGLNVNPGDFAENLTTEGIDLTALPLGKRLTCRRRSNS